MIGETEKRKLSWPENSVLPIRPASN